MILFIVSMCNPLPLIDLEEQLEDELLEIRERYKKLNIKKISVEYG